MDSNSSLCAGATDFCVDSATYKGFLTLSIISLLLNSANLFFLKKLDKSKRSAYFWIVVNIGICDIITCCTRSLSVSCEVNKKISSLPVINVRIFQVATNVLSAVPFIVGNFILAIGSYERYVSICHPYQVNLNKIVNNIKLCLGIVWILSFILATTVFVINPNEYCFNEFGAMPSNLNIKTSVAFSGSITITFFTSVICLSKAWRELKRMQSRSPVPAPDDLLVKRSAQYIIIVAISLHLSYGIIVMSAVSNGFDNIARNFKYFVKWICYFYITVYSIFNVLLYFFLTPGYRAHAMNLLKLRRPTVRPN